MARERPRAAAADGGTGPSGWTDDGGPPSGSVLVEVFPDAGSSTGYRVEVVALIEPWSRLHGPDLVRLAIGALEASIEGSWDVLPAEDWP